jgi:hypothetical protein
VLVIESKIPAEEIGIINRSKLVATNKQPDKTETNIASGFPAENDLKQKADELKLKIEAVIKKYTKDTGKISDKSVDLEPGDQIIWSPNNQTMIVARITELKGKAVKIDYAVEPVSVYSHGNRVPVFTHTAFIPKSVIVYDNTSPVSVDLYKALTVKKWYAVKGWTDPKVKKFNIKKYYLDGDKKVYV